MALDLHIRTSIDENYGTDEDPYWKPKGGQTYVVRNVTTDVDVLREIVRRLTPVIETHNDVVDESIISWEVVPAGMTTDELKEFWPRFGPEYHSLLRWHVYLVVVR